MVFSIMKKVEMKTVRIGGLFILALTGQMIASSTIYAEESTQITQVQEGAGLLNRQVLKILHSVFEMDITQKNINDSYFLILAIPQEISETGKSEEFADDFIAARNKAGIHKEEMEIRDTPSGDWQPHPTLLYIRTTFITANVLAKLEDGKGYFHSIPGLPVSKFVCPPKAHGSSEN